MGILVISLRFIRYFLHFYTTFLSSTNKMGCTLSQKIPSQQRRSSTHRTRNASVVRESEYSMLTQETYFSGTSELSDESSDYSSLDLQSDFGMTKTMYGCATSGAFTYRYGFNPRFSVYTAPDNVMVLDTPGIPNRNVTHVDETYHSRLSTPLKSFQVDSDIPRLPKGRIVVLIEKTTPKSIVKLRLGA